LAHALIVTELDAPKRSRNDDADSKEISWACMMVMADTPSYESAVQSAPAGGSRK
jgi:hypothetical protein